jgi:TPR repeat protein
MVAAPANSSSAVEPQPTAAAKSTTKPTTPKPAESPKQSENAARGMHTPAATVTPGSQPAADNVELQGSQGSGTDELVMAQRFLHGSSGQARDSAEAAKWLWKSIAKHNGPAMLELADLYLKGDGVSKNCDQARVLLDSAARRGMAGAGDRLRNLQAFGCQ